VRRRRSGGTHGQLHALTFTDPFGLCPQNQSVLSGLLCSAIEATTTFVGSLAGFAVGGGGGALLAVATGGANIPAVPAEAYAGFAAGAGFGLAAGRAVTSVLFSENSGSSAGGAEPPRERTAGEIISADKRGSINRVFPEQFRDKTENEIRRLAARGDRAARTALKLLTNSRYDK